MNVRLNEVIINKLEGIQNDIKIYLNMNAVDDVENLDIMHDNEVDELIKIRNNIKIMVSNMKKRMKK
jgi:predicted component of type VI protein secretion system